MIKFLYNVITKDKASEYDLSPEFWKSHPDWKFFVRTNVRAPWSCNVWLSGGGVTMEEAIKSATVSIETTIRTKAYGEETDVAIKNGPFGK